MIVIKRVPSCLVAAILHMFFGSTAQLWAQSGDPKFNQPIELMVGNDPLDVEFQGGAAPCFYDFDEDGSQDLLVGENFGGRLRIYPGKSRDPISFGEFLLFDDFSPDARIPDNHGFTPIVVDVDQDGMDDIVTPSWHGNVSWFRQTAPLTYAGRELIRNTQEAEIEIEWTLSVAAADWNSDNRVDLLVTTMPDRHGHRFFVLTNAGKNGQPRFENAVPIELGHDSPFEKSPQLHVSTVDWNHDGQFDLVIANGSKTVYLLVNRGQATFGKPVELRVLPEGHAMSGVNKFCIADVNGDGQFDFLVGEDGGRFQKQFTKRDLEKLDSAKTDYQAALVSWGRVFRSYANIRHKQTMPEALSAVRKQVVKENQRQLSLYQDIIAMQLENQQHSYVWLIQGR